MTTVPWILFIIGLVVVCAGFIVGWRSGGKTIVLLGTTNVVIAATILVENWADQLSVAAFIGCAVYLIVVFATSLRGSWQRARLGILLGVATIVGIWLLYSLGSAPTPLRTIVLVLVSAFGVAFVTVSLVKGSQAVGKLRQ
jgi:hypothetical protein